MALDKYTITVKLDEESRAIMQNAVDNLAKIESLLIQTVQLFSANLGEVLKTEVTERQDPLHNGNAISIETISQNILQQMKMAGTK